MTKQLLWLVAVAGCDMLKPRVADVTVDAPPRPPDSAPDTSVAGTKHVLPPGSSVPLVSDSAELTGQIKVYDGLSDSALAGNGGVVTRSTGKAGGATVMYWSFGAVPMEGNFIVSAPLYVLADDDGAGNLTPRTDHPWLIDSIPGDARYSALRRVIYVPVTASYAGEVLTSIEALNEALELGLVGEPVPAGHWRNMPVVPPGTRLELGGTAEPMAATKVYGRGYQIDLFPLGGTLGIQPLRNGSIPMGQESRLLSGVPTGTPPVLTTQMDPQPVFQFGIPAAPPTTSYNYTPVVTQLEVRLATGIAPAAITHDNQLFARSGFGSITGFYADSVASYTVAETVSNKQIQFAEGSP